MNILMKLYLIRHGIASESDGLGAESDSQRALTAEGRDKINQIARALKKLDIQPDVILSSPYIRAEQTATILAKKFDRKQNLKFSEALIPDGKTEALFNEIVENYLVDELFIVGHEPGLSLFISMLVAANPDLAINIKKGGVCCLFADNLRVERRASLEWLLPPKILLEL